MPRDSLVDELIEQAPDGGPVRIAKAPYRISPLGAHTDHQNGLVLGFSLKACVRIAFRARDDGVVQATSRDFPGVVNFDLAAIGPRDGTFGDYLRGIAQALVGRGGISRGIVARISGELQPGGVSSSAALQIAFMLALADANGVRLDKAEMVRLVVAAERNYAGVQVGVLDPTIILHGDDGRLVSLDCAEGTPRAQRIPGSLPRFEVMLVESGVKRDLRTAPYNERVAECREAARLLGSTSDVPMLSEFSVEDVRRRRASLPPVLARRAEHVVSENKRVRNGMTLLQQGDLRNFGQLMTASGRSMITHFGAGTPETTALLDLLAADPSVFGACLSGAGFGGSLMAFIQPGTMGAIRDRVTAALAVTDPECARTATFRVTSIGGACSVVDAGAPDGRTA